MKTYCIDTNYLLRLLLRDNEAQFQTVYRLFEQAVNKEIRLIAPVIVFFELYWVLSSVYNNKKKQVTTHLSQILSFGALQLENKPLLQEALELFEKNSLDLEDCYAIVFARQNGAVFSSFDVKASKISAKRS